MKIIKYLLIPFVLMAAFLVFRMKPEWLMLALDENEKLPLGTLISWLLVIAWALAFYLLAKRKVAKQVLFANVVLGIFWGIVAFFISGNWSFNFSSQSGFYVWILLTACVVLFPVFFLVFTGVLRWLKKD